MKENLVKLFDSELIVMEVLWENGDLSAAQIAKIINNKTGWNRNTTYTVINKCITKAAIERYEPKFMCRATVSREQAQHDETCLLINKLFDSSPEKFFATFINSNSLSEEEIDHLRAIIENSR